MDFFSLNWMNYTNLNLSKAFVHRYIRRCNLPFHRSCRIYIFIASTLHNIVNTQNPERDVIQVFN